MTPISMKYNPAFLDDETLIQSFVVRTAELARILEVIRENSGETNQHVLIIGPRGIGKTTLVLRSAAEVRTVPELSAHWHPIVFGEETYQVSTPGEFWLEALFHLGQQTGEARWQQAYEELLREDDEDRLHARAISQLMDFADERGKRLLIIVENLNMLVGSQISEDEAWVLRKTLMNEPRLMLLGTATSRFDAIDEYNQALYELFRIIDVRPLERGEAQDLWAKTTGQDVSENRIRPLQILTGGNPRLIRILSEFAAKTSFSSLMDDLTRLVDEHTEYFKHHLDNLPPQERKVFVVLADLWDPTTARDIAEMARLDVNLTSALLKRLMERGAVTSPYKRGRAQYYQVAERMYNIYHLMRRRGPAASRVHAVVRFMVSLYRDTELVQTTRSLVEEASGLAAGHRREHFAAYEAIVHHARKLRLTEKIVEATRYAFATMPDAPASILKLVGLPSQAGVDTETASEGLASETTGSVRVDSLENPTVLLRLAEQLSEVPERLGEAEAAFEKALRLDPSRAFGWHLFGWFLLTRLDRPDRALESIDRALALSPENASTWYNRGVVLGMLGRGTEELESYDRALALDPNDANTWYNRGVTLGSDGHNAGALESFDRALKLDPENASTWYNRGVALGMLGRGAEELESYGRALALNPEDSITWYNRAMALGLLGDNAKALESFDRALKLDPEHASAWYNRGIALGLLGRDAEELESYDRALMLDPAHDRAWYNRGVTLGKLGHDAEELEAYDQALALNPELVEAWCNRGIVLGRLRRDAEELESYDRALALNPKDADTWYNRGVVLETLGRNTEALNSFDRASTLNPKDVATWYNRGAVLERLGRETEALDCYDRAIALDPQNAALLLTRGLMYWRLQQFRDAETSLRQAVALETGVAAAITALLKLLLDTRRADEAVAIAEESLDNVNGDPEAFNSLAWMFFKNAPVEALGAAERWARKAVALMPEAGAARHTLAAILGARHKWGEAMEQAALFLTDDAMLVRDLADVIDFFIDAIGAGKQDEVLKVIRAADRVETLEPLVVAIQRLGGVQVDVAREVLEVANDVLKRIEERGTLVRAT